MKRQKLFRTIMFYILLLLLTAIFLFPVVWMLVSSLKNEAQIFRDLGSLKAFVPPVLEGGSYFSNYIEAFRRVPLLLYAWNSLFYTSIIIVFGLLINSMAAYAFARLNFPLRDFWFAVVVALLIIPLESIFLPLFLTVHKFGWINTYTGLIVPFIANAFSIFLFRQFFLGLPVELEESAKIDGASIFRIYFQIIIPLSKPVFATVAIFTFITHWNDFLWPLMVITDESMRTIQIGLNTFFNQPPIKYGQVMAALTFATVPMVLVFAFFQKYYIQGLSHTGSKN